MPPSKRKETQHEKFVKLASELGADESESAFADTLRRIAPDKKLSPARKQKIGKTTRVIEAPAPSVTVKKKLR